MGANRRRVFGMSNNPFQSKRSNINFDVEDLFVIVILPMIPVVGFAAIGGSLMYLITDGENEFGTADEASRSVVWGIGWQIFWNVLLVIA